MADDNPIEAHEDTNPVAPKLDTGIPDAATDLDPANDLRSQDYGESGQFAPGGYFNQHGVTESERLDLDEQTANIPGDDKK
ncbi:MAG TPA: hypothetical protein VGB17_09560 [Pyrinomonadaceae bacterium]|jgi:hypothetical protein